ncbi:hypothetical protein [Paraburkholderia piptadeniae]|nr:hypothetical protein [Paraburkholderia piptadeniae]
MGFSFDRMRSDAVDGKPVIKRTRKPTRKRDMQCEHLDPWRHSAHIAPFIARKIYVRFVNIKARMRAARLFIAYGGPKNRARPHPAVCARLRRGTPIAELTSDGARFFGGSQPHSLITFFKELTDEQP